MAIRIERVELSRNPVQAGEQLKVSVTIVTHGYLSHSAHRELTGYTHKRLKERGTEQ